MLTEYALEKRIEQDAINKTKIIAKENDLNF